MRKLQNDDVELHISLNKKHELLIVRLLIPIYALGFVAVLLLFLVLTDYVINDRRTVHIGLPIKRLLVVHKDRLRIGAGNYELALVNSFIYD